MFWRVNQRQQVQTFIIGLVKKNLEELSGSSNAEKHRTNPSDKNQSI